MNPPALRILCCSLCLFASTTAMAQAYYMPQAPLTPYSSTTAPAYSTAQDNTPLVPIPTLPKNAEPVRTPDEADDKGVVSFVFENDIVDNTDRGYTNGFRGSWLSSEKHNPDWLNDAANWMPLLDSSGNKRVSLAIGQDIYTPRDLQRNPPDPNDQPYAGWLYGSMGLLSDTGKTLDNVQLTLGMVGPASGAEQTQKTVHNLIGDEDPKGWHSQLHDEPGVILTYERSWRDLYEASAYGLGADIIPHVGANLGNVDTSAAVGTTFRLGYDLPADYGPPRIRPSLLGSDFFIPSKELSYYLFSTVEGRAVGRNIFLDGNTFESSPSVDKEILVGSLQVGAAVTYEDFRLSYTQVFMSKQYTTETRPDQYGSLSLSYRF